MKKKCIQIIAIFIIQSFLLMNSAFAGPTKNLSISTLSPTIKVSLPAFINIFDKAFVNSSNPISKINTPKKIKGKIKVIGVPAEILSGEGRVGLSPLGVQRFVEQGYRVIVQTNAGKSPASPEEIGGARIDDREYIAAGAEIVQTAEEVWQQADMIIKIKEPLPEEYNLIQSGQVIFTYFHLAPAKELTTVLMESGATCIAYETVILDGRTPLLAPMSEVAGVKGAYTLLRLIEERLKILSKYRKGRKVESPDDYRKEIVQDIQKIDLEHVDKVLPGETGIPEMTAEPLPGYKPGKVVVFGGGIVGMNAALTSLRLGAEEVTITETNFKQVKFLKAFFKEKGFDQNKITVVYDTRRKKVRTQDEKKSDAVLMQKIKEADGIISGIYVHGSKPDLALTKKEMEQIGSGKVIIDVSIDQGGSTASTRPSIKTKHEDPIFIDKYGNIIYSVPNMPAGVPRSATFMLERSKIDYAIAIAKLGVDAVNVYPELLPGISIENGKLRDMDVAFDQKRQYTWKGRPRSPFGASNESLVPEQLRSKIMDIIRNQLLESIDIQDIKSIRVKFKGTDKYFSEDVFEKDPAISGQKAGTDAEKDTYIKKVMEIYKGRKEDWQAMKINNLKAIYHIYEKSKKIRNKLIHPDAGIGAQWIDFDVTITLHDEKIETVIRAQRDKDDFRVALKENIEHEISPEAEKQEEVPQEKQAGGEEELSFLFSYLKGDENKGLRRILHGLSDASNKYNQINDFQATIRISLGLQKARTMCQANLDTKLSYPERIEVEQLIKQAIQWGGRTRKVEQKKQVSELLSQTIGQDGHLINGEIRKTIEVIDEALELIKTRLNVVLESIQRRNEKVLTQAEAKRDQILYLEWIKNKIIEAQGYVYLEDMASATKALFSFGKAVRGMENISFDSSFGATYSSIIPLMRVTDSCLISKKALQLLKKTDYYVQRQAEKLTGLRNDFKKKKFDKYEDTLKMNYVEELDLVIDSLISIEKSEKRYEDVIKLANERIQSLISNINDHAKKDSRMKGAVTLFVKRLNGVVNSLTETLKTTKKRNAILNIAPKPAQGYKNVKHAREFLQQLVNSNDAKGIVSSNIAKIHEKLDTLYIATLSLQQDAYLKKQENKERQQEFEKIREDRKRLSDEIGERLSKTRISSLLVGQAI